MSHRFAIICAAALACGSLGCATNPATGQTQLSFIGTDEEVALGNGPVDAAYRAVDKIISPPEYGFEDYVIQSVSEGKDTMGEVMTTLKYADRLFVGRGLSTDVIEASILAYIHAQNKLMAYYNQTKEDRIWQ